MAPSPSPSPRLFVADDKFPDVIAQLQARGWTRFPHGSFPRLDLRWTNYAKIAWSRVREAQIVNHFHNAVVLSRKNELAAQLYGLARRDNGDSGIGTACGARAVDAYYPRTLDLAKPAQQQTLVAWFLYAKAVGVLLSTENQGRGRHACAAIGYLKRVLATNAFFSCWPSELEVVAALDVWSEQWSPLRSGGDGGGADEDEGEDLSVPREDANDQEVQRILNQLRQLDVQFDCIAPGCGDVWICKPSNLSQGRGIHLVTDLDALLRLASPSEALEEGAEAEAKSHQAHHPQNSDVGRVQTAWVVQKYIERPLLQQNHKFDVRQWVLITALEPLTVYWHQDCYLRFCSHPFSLRNEDMEDAFTHLSNYSIQKNAPRDEQNAHDGTGKSFESMWHSSRFQNQLRQKYGRDVWEETIVPQMRHASLAAIKAALPEMKQIGRGFEWLGIDFLIDSSHRVWLLEVNVSPDVSHSTEVTANLVPAATRGVLDLVLGGQQAMSNPWIQLDLQ